MRSIVDCIKPEKGHSVCREEEGKRICFEKNKPKQQRKKHG